MNATVTEPVRVVSGGTPGTTAVYVGDRQLPGVTRIVWEADSAGGFAHAVVHLADVQLDLATDSVEIVTGSGGEVGAPEGLDP